MKIFLTFLISFVALSGCATTSPNPWDGLDVDMSAAATSIDCGSFPLPSGADDVGATYDKSGMNDLNDYRKCSEDNASIVDEHAKQIGELKVVRRSLSEAGQAQRNIATMKQEMLDDERRHNLWSSIRYWVVIIAMGASL